jgi:hypothetical protein
VLDPVGGRGVTLTTAQQVFGHVYTLSVTGVKDRFGNAGSVTALFQSTILIDGNFEDWSGVPVALTQDQLNPGSVEYKDLSITNDTDYVYVRFTYYGPVGPLGPNSYGQNHQVVFNTDSDPGTGGWNGGEVMVENLGVLRLGGNWTVGEYVGGNVAIAPGDAQSTQFELRVSRHATYEADGSPAFPNPSFEVFCCTRTGTDWSEMDLTAPPVSYTFGTLPPVPATIVVTRVGAKIELTWPRGGVLETRASLNTGSWAAVTGAVSGIQIDPTTAAAGYYRVRQ